MTVRTTELLSPVSKVAITSIAKGFSQGMIVRSTAKRPSTSGVARFPLTLTVASGEVIPITVMVSELITVFPDGKVTSNCKGGGVAVGSDAGSAVEDGKGALGVAAGVGVKVGAWVGLGVSVGAGVVMVTGVGEDAIVAVGAMVGDSSPQEISRTRMRPKMKPTGAILRNGAITAIDVLAANCEGLLSPEYRDMHIPPNTSSNGY